MNLIQLRKSSHLGKLTLLPILNYTAAKDTHGMNKEQKDALRGFTITIKNLHIRYEDDYYSGENPYSFGAVIDVSHILVSVYIFFS